MQLKEALEKINERFENKMADFTWSILPEIAARAIESLEVQRREIIQLAEELNVSRLDEEQRDEAYGKLITQAEEAINKEYEESPLDMTTSFDEGQQDHLSLEMVQESIRSNINSRIIMIIREAIGEEPTPMLIEMLNPGYLALHHPDVEIIEEVADNILENLSEQIDPIRDQINNLIELRTSLVSDSISIDDQACMDITGTINQIVNKMNISLDSEAQRIREILLKVANDNSGAAEHAMEVGVSESDIKILQNAAREYGQSREDDLLGVIRNSVEEEIIHPPLLIMHQEEFITNINSESILQDLYQYILSQSDRTPLASTEELIDDDDGVNQEPIFKGLDTLNLSIEEINEQIFLYLRQLLLGEEGTSRIDIIDYVTNIIGRIDDPNSHLGEAQLRIQELLEMASVEYDEFFQGIEDGGSPNSFVVDGAVYQVIPDDSSSIGSNEEYISDDDNDSSLIRILIDVNENHTMSQQRVNTPVTSISDDNESSKSDDDDLDYTTIPPAPETHFRNEDSLEGSVPPPPPLMHLESNEIINHTRTVIPFGGDNHGPLDDSGYNDHLNLGYSSS